MQRLELPRHTFALRALPRSSTVLTNVEHRAIQAIDCASGKVEWSIDFPEGSSEHFSILQWYVAPGGDWSLALDENDLTHGVRFDHDARTSQRVDLPPGLGIPSGTCWFGSQLQFVTFDGLCWTLEGSHVAVGPPDPEFVAWGRRVEGGAPGYAKFNQIRTDFGDGRAYFLSPGIERVGVVSIPGGEVRDVEGNEKVVDLAEASGSLYVSMVRRILRHWNGRTDVFFEPAQNERIHGIAAVGHEEKPQLVALVRVGGGSCALIVQAAPPNGTPASP